MEKINWGILGLGEIAHKFSKGFFETTNAKLLAVASKDLEKTKIFKDHFNVDSKYLFNSYEDLINCKEVDIVYIALPNSLHYEWALKSIKNLKHVLVEKPVTLNLEEIKDIKRNLINERLFFGEAFMYRHHPQTNLILDIIKNREIGNLVSMKSNFGINLLSKKKFLFFNKKKKINPNSRLFNKKLGGGCILDLGCYPSSFSLLIGSLISNNNKDFKIKKTSIEMGETNVDIDSYAKIYFDENFFSEINASFKKNLGNKSEIKGEKGTIIINDTWLGNGNIAKIDNNRRNQIINIKNNKNIYSYQIQNISKTILDNSFQDKYRGMSLNESLINMKIIEEWLNG